MSFSLINEKIKKYMYVNIYVKNKNVKNNSKKNNEKSLISYFFDNNFLLF